MLRLYHGRFHRLSRCRHQALQRHQGRPAHIGQTRLPHLAADNRIKHPLRKLQCGRPLQFVSHATQNRTATASCFDLNAHLLPRSWMPAVLHFSNAGSMGVLYPTCTTHTDRTRRSMTGHRQSSLLGRSRASCSGASSGTRRQPFIRLFA
jgi:hypothetical protein